MFSVRVAEPTSGRIFISYRREDAPGHVLALSQLLSERFGADRIFKDTDNIDPGDDFVDAIQRELNSCSVLLVVIGREWLTARDPRLGTPRIDTPDDFVRLEVATGLTSQHVLVIPVLVERATMPAVDDLPPNLKPLARRNAIELNDARWSLDVERLVRVIERAGGDLSRAGGRTGLSRTTWLLAVTILAGGLGVEVWRSFTSASTLQPPPTDTSTGGSGGRVEIGTTGNVEYANRQYQQGDRVGALDTAVRGLDISPNDAGLLALLATMLRDAQGETSQAKQTAITAGAANAAAADFRMARDKEAEAAKARDTDLETSIRFLWAATADFDKATRTARAIAEKGKSGPPGARVGRNPDDGQAKDIAAAKAEADKKQIGEVLERFRAAYNGKRFDDILQIYPGLSRVNLESKFRNCRQVDLTFAAPDIFLRPPDGAHVQVRSTYGCQPTTGQSKMTPEVVDDEFRLERQGLSWIIVRWLVPVT